LVYIYTIGSLFFFIDETVCADTCPQIPKDLTTILSGIVGLPEGSTASFIRCHPSHQDIGGNLVRSCAECHYQIDLPSG